MGGRAQELEGDRLDDREAWIAEVSDSRLDRYAAMTRSAGAARRVDGTPRLTTREGRTYFSDLIDRERMRRGR